MNFNTCTPLKAFYVPRAKRRRAVICALPLAILLLTLGVAPVSRGGEDRREIVIHQSSIGITGRNFRDMGGYETSDGRVLRHGVLYRSGNLSGLSPPERDKLAALGIRGVCDFRSGNERREQPDPDIPGWQQLEACHDNSLKTSLATSFQKLLDAQAAGRKIDWRGIMIENYRNMGARYAEAYRALFLALLSESRRPMLFHCTAGKDRTGVAAALVLSALGVPRETVLQDYEASALDPVTVVNVAESTVYPEELTNQPALSRPDPAYIQSAIEGIEEQYGSLENYFHAALDLDGDDIEQLRSALLMAR